MRDDGYTVLSKLYSLLSSIYDPQGHRWQGQGTDTQDRCYYMNTMEVAVSKEKGALMEETETRTVSPEHLTDNSFYEKEFDCK